MGQVIQFRPETSVEVEKLIDDLEQKRSLALLCSDTLAVARFVAHLSKLDDLVEDPRNLYDVNLAVIRI